MIEIKEISIIKALYTIAASISFGISLCVLLLSFLVHNSLPYGSGIFYILVASNLLSLGVTGYCFVKSFFYSRYIKMLRSENLENQKEARRYFISEGILDK